MFIVGMRRFDVPVAPVIVGMILGPMSEKQLRLALTISQGGLAGFTEFELANPERFT